MCSQANCRQARHIAATNCSETNFHLQRDRHLRWFQAAGEPANCLLSAALYRYGLHTNGLG
jgi:hypothetical protein